MSRPDQVIAYGLAEVGQPYVWGAEGPDAFDCSGLMLWIFGRAGITLPRTAREQQRAAKPVDTPRPGDLVFWDNPATHVGLYLGDGRYLAAPGRGKTVRVSKLYGRPTYGRPVGLAGLGGVVSGVVSPVTEPVASGAAGLADKIGGMVIASLVIAGGAALLVVGGWQATKGSGSG